MNQIRLRLPARRIRLALLTVSGLTFHENLTDGHFDVN
jgi:hypothetical protein